MSTYRIQVRVTQDEHPRTQVLEFDHAPLVIGALPRNDVVLDHENVSGDHAVVTVSRRVLVTGTAAATARVRRRQARRAGCGWAKRS